ncbi:MAG: hypothetical protein AB8B60_12285 [Sulfitobacter sp.]
MAKAKKPVSSSGKGKVDTPKSAADAKADDGTTAAKPSAASQAAVAKGDKKTGAAAAKPNSTKAATAKTENKPDAKPVDAKSKDVTPPKTPEPAAAKAATPKTQSVAKDSGSKAASAKPDVADKSWTQEKKSETKSEAKPAASTPASAPKTTPPPPAKAPENSGGGFLPLLLGGVLAGVIGFAISELNVLNTRIETDKLEATLNQQQEDIATLQSAEPEAPDLSGITGAIESLSETVSVFEARLAELESRPIVTVEGEGAEAAAAAAAAYAEELATLQASVETQRDEIAGLLENARSVKEATAQAAQRAAVQAALTEITVAISGGGAFADSVGAISDAGIADIPAGLTDVAQDGVATVSALQADFPDVARSALSAARATGVDDGASGLGGFLSRQLGARSTVPREGSDPDAVLSRAEAAVREGRVGDALSEIDTLPPEVQSAMDGWVSKARARADATAAVQELSQRLTAN